MWILNTLRYVSLWASPHAIHSLCYVIVGCECHLTVRAGPQCKQTLDLSQMWSLFWSHFARRRSLNAPYDHFLDMPICLNMAFESVFTRMWLLAVAIWSVCLVTPSESGFAHCVIIRVLLMQLHPWEEITDLIPVVRTKENQMSLVC